MAVPLVIGWHLNGCVPDVLEEAEEAPDGLLVGGTLVIVSLGQQQCLGSINSWLSGPVDPACFCTPLEMLNNINIPRTKSTGIKIYASTLC